MKLLAVKFDHKLSFVDHISELCKKASIKIHALLRVTSSMNISKRRILLSQFSNSITSTTLGMLNLVPVTKHTNNVFSRTTLLQESRLLQLSCNPGQFDLKDSFLCCRDLHVQPTHEGFLLFYFQQ